MTPSAASAASATTKAHAADPKRLSAKGNTVSNRDPKLTVAEVCDELNVAKSTFYDWRTKGRAPRCIRLPNGDLRIRRSELDRWIDAREDAA
jgi:excisionase family DNA binding protein